MSSILVKGGRVFDGDTFLFADVLVREGKVAVIAPDISEKADFVFDATGKTVLSGLVDLHMHRRGISCDAFGTPAEGSCFPFGVTAAVDGCAELGDKDTLSHSAVKGGVFVASEIQSNRFLPERTERLLEAYGDTACGVKLFFDTMGGEVTNADALRAVSDFAHARGLRVMVHSSHSPIPMAELLSHLRAGDVLTHAFHGGEHNAALDRFASLAEAKSRGVVIDVGFAGHVHTDFAVLRDAIAAGMLPDTISTDLTCRSVFTRGGRYGLTMCMSIARTLGMREADVFRAVTRNPAKALGKAWGTLAIGGVADLAVLDDTDEGFSLTDVAGNRVEDDSGYRCVLTVSDGQVVYRD